MARSEGRSFDFLDESHIDSSLLEVFDFESPKQYIKTETDEFSAVCPFSGLPDIAYVKIEYFPTGGKCVELNLKIASEIDLIENKMQIIIKNILDINKNDN